MSMEGSTSGASLLDFDCSMSVEELADWLNKNGIPREFCEAFEGMEPSY